MIKMRKSEKWWKAYHQRQTAAANRFDELDPLTATDDEIIEATAEYLIANYASSRKPYKLYLSILNMSEERPVSYDWQYKNVRGITTTIEARARAWIRECMLQGYGVFGAGTKGDGGGGKGCLRDIRERQLERARWRNRKLGAPL
jgi:hypothetical protein